MCRFLLKNSVHNIVYSRPICTNLIEVLACGGNLSETSVQHRSRKRCGGRSQYLYINLRRSRDCILLWLGGCVCVCVRVRVCVCACVCLASCAEYCVGPSHA